MNNADKNRDPERARKRAKSDARCALRKLEILDRIERWYSEPEGRETEEAFSLLVDICVAVSK